MGSSDWGEWEHLVHLAQRMDQEQGEAGAACVVESWEQWRLRCWELCTGGVGSPTPVQAASQLL